jgi:hypothetical protein
VDGAPVGSAVTEGTGYYDLRAPYDPTADATVLLWFMAPDHVLMPKMLVLQESRACKEQSIISACIPRASLTPGHQFRVYLFDPQTRNKELSELDCLP